MPLVETKIDEVTVNATPLLTIPATVTDTFPELAPFGTDTTIWVSLQLSGVAKVPLNETVLERCFRPNPAPVMVTVVPAGPEVGETPLIEAGEVTKKLTPSTVTPLTVTDSSSRPSVVPTGTGTTICVSFQLVGVAKVPLKLTVLPI
jgi:hypothetical protein